MGIALLLMVSRVGNVQSSHKNSGIPDETQRVVSVIDWRPPPPSHTFIIFVDLKGVIGNSTGWIPDISQNAPTLENANELHDFQKS